MSVGTKGVDAEYLSVPKVWIAEGRSSYCVLSNEYGCRDPFGWGFTLGR